MNRLAVCLRGEVRNWNYTKEAVFKFYEGIAYSVDYYYATWDVPYIDQNKLNATFDNRKLVQGVLCPSGNDRRRWGGFLGPAFLSSHIKLNKRYDAIIDTRFDLIPVRYPWSDVITVPPNMEIQTTNVDHTWNHPEFDDPTAKATSDQWAIMDTATWDQFNYRLPLLYEFWMDKINGKKIPTINEIGYTKVIKQMNIIATKCMWMSNLLVRPNIIDIFPKSTDIIYSDWSIIFENYMSWNSISNDKRKQYCIDQNIHLKDYGL
jgi:hypothetical protein